MNRRNIFWLIASTGTIGVSFLIQSPYMTYLLWSFYLLVILSNLSTRLWLNGIECQRELSQNTLQQGEETQIIIRIINKRMWPVPWVFIEDQIPEEFTVTGETKRLAILMPGQSTTLQFNVRCPSRGYHRIGPLMIETGDFFGLQKHFRLDSQRMYISVLPTIAYIETFTINTRRPQGTVRISNRIYEDPTRIRGIRKYVPGDPLHAIHWKASAHATTLMVKQNEPSTIRGATLILDLFHINYLDEQGKERMELAITTAASLAYLLQASGEQVGLITNGRDAAEIARYETETGYALSRQQIETLIKEEEIQNDRLNPLEVPTRRSPVQARHIAENLARVLLSDGLDITQLILHTSPRLSRDASLIIIVPKITEDTAAVLGTMKLSGFLVTVFLIKNSHNYEQAIHLLAPYNIDIIPINHERNLHELSIDRIGR